MKWSVLSRPRWAFARVSGESMRPTLAPRDVLLIRLGPAVRPGDVVVCWLPGCEVPVVKRVSHRDPEGWWVERDNARQGVDSWSHGAVADDAVVGRVICRLWPSPRFLSQRSGAPGIDK